MKKYVIAFILFIIALFSINNAYASTVKPTGWALDIEKSSIISAFDCSSSSSCGTSLSVNLTSVNDVDNNFGVGSYAYVSSVTTGNLGFMWVTNVNSVLKSGYLYNLTGYFCNNSSKSYVLKDIVTGNNQSDVSSKAHPLIANLSGAINTIDNNPYYNGGSSSSFSCSYISRFIVPSVNSQYVGWNISTDGSVTGSQYYYGYTLSELGVYEPATKSDLQSAISGSGLASAQSVQDVENAVSDVQSELQSSTSSINNSIQDSEVNILSGVADGISSVNGNLATESQNIQNGIKDGFETCRDSYNLFPYRNISITTNRFGDFDLNFTIQQGKTYTLSWDSATVVPTTNYQGSAFTLMPTVTNYQIIDTLSVHKYTFTASSTSSRIRIYKGANYDDSPNFESLNITNLMLVEGSIPAPFEPYGEQVCKNRIDSTNEKLDDLNNTMNNSSITGANSDASGFFSGFTSNDFGLSSIVTMPLQFISHLSDNNTCNSLILPLPFVNQNVTLPCMTSIYNTYFHDFLVLYQTITTGFISYWVCINIFRMVQGFKNPESDQIEVMDL